MVLCGEVLHFIHGLRVVEHRTARSRVAHKCHVSFLPSSSFQQHLLLKFSLIPALLYTIHKPALIFVPSFCHQYRSLSVAKMGILIKQPEGTAGKAWPAILISGFVAFGGVLFG
jgi:hypothetical protein